MRLKELKDGYRPREKLQNRGSDNLTDFELLSIIIRTGYGPDNVLDLSTKLLKDGLKELGRMSLEELKQVRGIGEAKACQIQAVFELCERISFESEKKKVTSPEDVYDICEWMKTLDKEHFLVLLLDTKNNVFSEDVVSVGTLNASIVHPREVFRKAIRNNCNAIILVHNHPSGDTTPSQEDYDVTRKLQRAGEHLDIEILDHVIIGEGYTSIL